MRGFVFAMLAVCMCAGVARADERQDLVHEVLEAQIDGALTALTPQINDMALSLGAGHANLTDDEKHKLEVGLTLTLRQTITDLTSPVLNDEQRFSIEDLRSIRAFVTSPAGHKWNSLGGQIDTKSPAMRAKFATALLTNIDPVVLGKLAAARHAATGDHP